MPARQFQREKQSPSSGIKRSLTGASLLILAIATVPVSPAAANDECGAASGGVAICDDATLNPYADGIGYYTSTGMHLDVKSGVVVDRSGSATPHDGILLQGTGDDPLLVTIARGVTIKTFRAQDDPVQVEVTGAGNSDIRLESGADIEIRFGANPLPGSPTSALFGWNQNGSSTGSITINQLSGSTLDVIGEEAVGIEALQQGLGDVTLISSGTIVGEGYWGAGMMGWIANSLSDANLTIAQTAEGTITYTGDQAVGIYALTSGGGNVNVDIAGHVTVRGNDAYGSLASLWSATGLGTVVHKVAATAVLTTEGTEAPAMFTSTAGLGATATTVAGTVTTSGDKSHGIFVDVQNAANDQVHAVALEGAASIATDGDQSHGINAIVAGSGPLIINASGESRIAVSGADSAAIMADASALGRVAITTGPNTLLSASGANGRGIAAYGFDTATVEAAGTVRATGEYGAAIDAFSSDDKATVTIGTGATITGGWQADLTGVSASTSRPAAAVVIGSASGSLITNGGTLSAASDRAIYDIGRDLATTSALTVVNDGTITGFVDYANVAGNRFDNRAGATFHVRHLADTNGDGTRDTRRVAVADFGESSSIFSNAGTVRVGGAESAATVDGAGYYVPTTGAGARPLETSFYNFGRAAQAQLVNLGRFEHGGVIDLRGPSIGNALVITSNPAAGGAAGNGVFVSNGGELRLNAVLNAGMPAGGQTGSLADMLIVDGTMLGSAPTRIMVGYDAAGGAITTGNGIQLVEVRNKAASAAGVFSLGNAVVSGAYEYNLYHHGVGEDAADGNWYLRSSVTDTETGEELPAYRPETPVLTSPQVIAVRFGLDTLGTYHDRHGEDYADWLPRDAAQSGAPSDGHDGRAGAMWGRVYGLEGDVGYKRQTMAQQAANFRKYGPAFEYETFGFQLGFDLLRSTGDNGARNVAGVYGAYGHTSADIDAVYGGAIGRLKLDGYNLGFYYTHKSSGGAYIDAVLQGTRYDSTLRSRAGAQFLTDGWGFAASIEGGAPVKIGDGWRLEPQAQLIYQRVKLDNTGDAHTLVDYGNVKAVWGRLGARAGKVWQRSSGLSSMAWARFNLWHDFKQDAVARLSNSAGDNVTSLNASLGGTWGQAQLALSSELARNVSGFVSGDYNFSLDGMKSDAIGGRIGLKFVW